MQLKYTIAFYDIIDPHDWHSQTSEIITLEDILNVGEDAPNRASNPILTFASKLLDQPWQSGGIRLFDDQIRLSIDVGLI